MEDRVVFTVGELARRTGLPAHTIRLWGVPSLEHLRAGLRAHGWVLAALRAHA